MDNLKNGICVFTGDRAWTANAPVRAVVDALPMGTIVIQGGARGLDTMAGDLALLRGLPVIRMDAPWNFYGKRAGPVRNQWMLDVALALAPVCGPIQAHAFHNYIAQSKGTLDMVGRCKAAGLVVPIHSVPSRDDDDEG